MTQGIGAAEAPDFPRPSFTSAGVCYSSYIKTITCKNPKDREARFRYLKAQLTAQIGLSLCSSLTLRTQHLLGTLGVKWRSDQLFPWRNMLMELANAGVMLVNWPENCRHPGQVPRESNKGISELIASEQIALVDALVDPEHRLYFMMVVDVEKKKGMFAPLIHSLSMMLM